MSRISPDELTRAIDLLDLKEVRRLIAEGANPYQANAAGKTALEAWQESQTKGNPYAGQMGLVLLETKPRTPEEEAHLTHIGQEQLRNIGQALGVLEHARQAGIGYDSAYIPPQNLESSQACWAAVRQALDNHFDTPPPLDAFEFSWHYAAGLAKGRQQVVRVPGTELANFSPSDEPVVPNPGDAEVIQRAIANYFGDKPVTLGSRGHIETADMRGEARFVSLTGMRSMEGHPAAVFHSDTFEGPDVFAGMPANVWFTKTLEDRLDNAIRDKDWARAESLVNRGADIYNLPIQRVTTRLMEANTAEETERMFSLGLDPLKPIPNPFQDGDMRLPIQFAKTQDQFDAIYRRMEDADPSLGQFQPQGATVAALWQNSVYHKPEQNLGHRVGEWLNQTTSSWRKGREPVSADNEVTPNKGPHP